MLLETSDQCKVVPGHNNHAWEDIPTDPPKIKHVYELDIQAEAALSEVMVLYNKEKRITTVVQNNIDQKIREILVTFVARKIPSMIRLWLCGHVLIGSDGSLWRTRSACHAIDKAFEEETHWVLSEIPSSDHEAGWVLGVLGLVG